MKWIGLIAVLLCGSLLIYGTADFPAWGDPMSPASTHVSSYYIERSLAETATPNIVTAVLADYRGYDTLFETVVIFSAGIACMFLLRIVNQPGMTPGVEKDGELPETSEVLERIDSRIWPFSDLIVQAISRMIIPFIQLYALYVIAHGHYSPGGGFQGGVILGASMILFAISHDLRAALNKMGEKVGMVLSAVGVFIYAATGLLCILLGANYLDYGGLAAAFGIDKATARSYGIFAVETGIGVAVMAVMAFLYYNLASAGTQEEGL